MKNAGELIKISAEVAEDPESHNKTDMVHLLTDMADCIEALKRNLVRCLDGDTDMLDGDIDEIIDDHLEGY